MPGVNNPLGVVQANRMRLCKLDSNGVPTPGAGKLYVTKALIELTSSPVYAESPEIEERNSEGTVCVNFKGRKSLKRLDGKITVCSPDPYLMNFLAGAGVIDPGSGPLGWSWPKIGEIDPTPISIELWAKRILNGYQDTDYPWMWSVYPRVTNMTIGEQKKGNNAEMPTFTFEAYENPNWYDGPANNWVGASDSVYHEVPCRDAKVPAASNLLVSVATS